MAIRLECWKCGESLRAVPKPITRFTRCPVCRVDLHVCRLCRHYDPRILGECRHERAERVVDKEQANFCTYFRPRPGAHAGDSDSAGDSAREALDALFGLEEDEKRTPEEPRAAAQRAREQLNVLFDLHKKDESGNEG